MSKFGGLEIKGLEISFKIEELVLKDITSDAAAKQLEQITSEITRNVISQLRTIEAK